VPNGTWNVGVSCNGGSDSLSQLGNYACPNNPVMVNIANNNVVTNLVIQICGGISISTTSPLPSARSMSLQSIHPGFGLRGNYNWSQTGGTLPGTESLSWRTILCAFRHSNNSGTFTSPFRSTTEVATPTTSSIP